MTTVVEYAQVRLKSPLEPVLVVVDELPPVVVVDELPPMIASSQPEMPVHRMTLFPFRGNVMAPYGALVL